MDSKYIPPSRVKYLEEKRVVVKDVLWGFKKKLTLKEYIDAKIKMLKKDFLIDLSTDDVRRFRACQGEIQVDNLARSLLRRKLR